MLMKIAMRSEPVRRDFLKLGSASALGVLTGGLSTTLAEEVASPQPAKRRYDCIVLGLGAMGSACIYQLAKRGASVLGIEQFDLAHALGSSGGFSRQTKVAPYLGGPFEPLIRRANENWQALEKDSGQHIFHRCGWLQIGMNQRLTQAQAGGEGPQIEILDAASLADRYPQFQNLAEGTDALFDRQGGLLPQLRDRLQVTRLSLGWFAPEPPAAFDVKDFPIWSHGDYYGFPVLPDFPGVKVAKHWRGSPTDPDRLDRMPNAGDEKLVRDYLGKHLPSANGTTLAFKVCMYTWGGPWLGPLPGTKHVTIIAACDGGGFKFSSAYGEALADLATEGETSLPVGFMKP